MNYQTDANASNSFFTYVFNILFGDNSASLTDTSLVPGQSPETSNASGANTAKMFDMQGNILHDVNLTIPNISVFDGSLGEFDANGNQVAIPDFNLIEENGDVNLALRLPYDSGGAFVKIFDSNNNVLLTIPLLQVKFNIGYEGDTLMSSNYTASYSISSQPVGVLDSNNYIC